MSSSIYTPATLTRLSLYIQSLALILSHNNPISPFFSLPCFFQSPSSQFPLPRFFGSLLSL